MNNKYLDINYGSLKESAVNSLKDAIVSRGFENAVIGVSGGLDSAIALTLLKQAIDPEHIFSYFMPYRTSSQQSKNDAQLIADHNDVKITEIDISEQVDLYFSRFENPGKLRIGNKCARERMSVLFDMAALNNALVIGTSNRSELTMGYGTLFGDLGSSINPIGNILKTQIFKLAEHMGIPQQIINKKPSADLWENQTDEDEMGVSYEMIDSFIYQYFDLNMSIDDIIRGGIDKHICELILKAYKNNAFKKQCPVILNVNIERR